jgi:hypothetical protein
MIVTVLGTTFKTDDICSISTIQRGGFNYEFCFKVTFKEGTEADIRLSSPTLTSSNAQEDIDYTFSELERVRKELIDAWHEPPQTKTITAIRKVSPTYN